MTAKARDFRIINAAIFLFLLLPFFSGAEDKKTPVVNKTGENLWLSSTTQADSDIIIEFFRNIGFDEKIEAVRSISGRKDKNVVFLLEYLYYSSDLKKEEREFLLFMVLDNTVNDRETLVLNMPFLEVVCLDIASWETSLLRKKIMDISVFMDEWLSEKVLVREAKYLFEKVKAEKRFNSLMLEECRVFFKTAEKTGSPVLVDYMDRIYSSAENIPYGFRNF